MLNGDECSERKKLNRVRGFRLWNEGRKLMQFGKGWSGLASPRSNISTRLKEGEGVSHVDTWENSI